MKKIFLILLAVFTFSLTTNVFALNQTFEVNGVEYTTDTPDRARDYFYYTYVKPLEESTGNTYDFVMTYYQNKYQFFYFETPPTISRINGSGNSQTLYWNSSNNCLYKESNNTNSCGHGERSLIVPSVLYSSYEFSQGDIIYVQKNITAQEIEDRYSQEDSPNVNIDFPISKEEFYCLLVFIATLILLLFFTWCFPMKGRRNL